MLDDFLKDMKSWNVHLLKRHGPTHDSCPAKLGDAYGVLGCSTVLWTRVWFDTKDDSQTLATKFSVDEGRKSFDEWKSKIGL